MPLNTDLSLQTFLVSIIVGFGLGLGWSVAAAIVTAVRSRKVP